MVASGCGVPRFLIQWVDKEYHRPDRTRKSVTTSLFVFFINYGYLIYGANADFKEDDVARFERCVYSQTITAPETLDTIKTLIETYKFVPVRGFGSPIDETVYLVSKADLKLVTGLLRNGLDIESVNDLVMERVLWRADVSDALVQSYLAVGFRLSPVAVKKGLQMARPAALEVLRTRVSAPLLQRLAEETIYDMFGPSIRGWNFTPEAVDFLMAAFPISEEVMEHAIFRLPGAPTDLPDSFPATRSYMKANPCPAWRWVLRNYGPTHRFTIACFDDALSRAAAERDLHALHDVFLEAGVQFRPRHVKILACRVLHRDMTANALHLLQAMRAQVTANFRETLKDSNPAPTMPGAYVTNSSSNQSSSFLPTPPASPIASPATLPIPIPIPIPNSSDASAFQTPPSSLENDVSMPVHRHLTNMDLQIWIRNLREEITENEEWDQRMRTTQLEGGPRGGAYRISRAPEDAIRFLEEAKEFVADLAPPVRSLDRKSTGKMANRFRASVVGGVGRQNSISSGNNSASGPSSSNRPIASLNRRNRGIVRRNSAPVAGAPFQGQASTSIAATQTTQAPAAESNNAITGQAMAAEPAAEADEGGLADDEDDENNQQGGNAEEGEAQANAHGEEVENAAQPTGPPPTGGLLSQRRSSRASTHSLPANSNRAFDGFVRRISSWWSTNISRGGPPHWDPRTTQNG
ncbi:hypothetical protein HDU97_009943 [Phlyctochytrium planicorne]|nr:hypothetical protein HDU97_009943 [Phlyctochytrium planicorne]